MSFGSMAYASFVRIHTESGEPTFPSWEGLSHVGRMAWEAAAQAVALAVPPTSLSSDSEEFNDFEEPEVGIDGVNTVNDVDDAVALTT